MMAVAVEELMLCCTIRWGSITLNKEGWYFAVLVNSGSISPGKGRVMFSCTSMWWQHKPYIDVYGNTASKDQVKLSLLKLYVFESQTFKSKL